MNAFKIVSLLTLMATQVFGQTEKLLQYELIEKKDRKFFEARVESMMASMHMPSNISYVIALLELEIRKLTGEKQMPGMFGLSQDDPVDEKTTAHLNNYLLKLKNAGLVNERDFNTQQEQINSKQYFHVIQILRGVQLEMMLDNYWKPSSALPYADSLKKYSIVTSQYDQLLKDIKDQKLRTSVDLLKYCNNTLVIDTREYSNKIEDYMLPIYTKMAGVLPDLEFTDFSFEIIEDNSWSDKAIRKYDIIISFKSHGKIYKQQYLFRAQNQKGGFDIYSRNLDKRPSPGIFNQVLEDLQSPLRLYTIAWNGLGLERESNFGIIALTADQAAALYHLHSYLMIEGKTETRPLTTDEINKALDGYRSIGLLDPSVDQQGFLNSKASLRTYNDILETIPGLACVFNTSASDAINPYTTLLMDLSKISRGNFVPTEVTSESTKKGKQVTLRFKLDSTPYKLSLAGYNEVEIDLTFLPFINKVMSKKGQFYLLPTDGEEIEVIEVIFLTPQQFDFLQKNGLGEIYEIINED